MIEYVFDEQKHMSAALDGEKLVGVCQYDVSAQGWAIVHTEVSPDYHGMGIARRLVEMVSRKAESQGIPVIPVCSYAKKVLS